MPPPLPPPGMASAWDHGGGGGTGVLYTSRKVLRTGCGRSGLKKDICNLTTFYLRRRKKFFSQISRAKIFLHGRCVRLSLRGENIVHSSQVAG